MLGMLSVFYTPVAAKRLLASVEAYTGRNWGQKSLTHELAAMVEGGLIDIVEQRYCCRPALVEHVTARVAQRGELESFSRVVLQAPDPSHPHISRVAASGLTQGFSEASGDPLLRAIRVAMHSHDVARFVRLVDGVKPIETCLRRWESVHPLRALCDWSFDAGWMDSLPVEIVEVVCDLVAPSGDPHVQDWMESWLLRYPDQTHEAARANLAWRAALRGRLSAAEALVGSLPTSGATLAGRAIRGGVGQARPEKPGKRNSCRAPGSLWYLLESGGRRQADASLGEASGRPRTRCEPSGRT